MSDVVAVGLITAGTTVIGTSVGAVVAYLTAKRNAETAVHNANRHAEVELKKVRAGTQRQLDEYREEERRNRQGPTTGSSPSTHSNGGRATRVDSGSSTNRSSQRSSSSAEAARCSATKP